jgi:hypothetical protein
LYFALTGALLLAVAILVGGAALKACGAAAAVFLLLSVYVNMPGVDKGTFGAGGPFLGGDGQGGA